MEELVDPKQQPRAVFVPFPGSRRRNTSMKRCRSGVDAVRDLLAPCLQSPCATMASVVLVVVEGVLIFLLLLLDISIQDSFRALSCWNSTEHNLTGIRLTASYIDDLKRPMQCTSTALLCAFLLEVSLRSFVSGRHLVRNYWELFDTLITLLTFSLNVAVLASYSVGKQVSLFIILFRLWRILELLGAPLSKYRYTSDAHLDHTFSTTSSVATVETYVAEQNIATLMLKIEELERDMERLQTDNRRLTFDQRKLKSLNHSLIQRIPSESPPAPPTDPSGVTLRRRETKCQRCVNHNWTTDDLLKMACMQLSRSDSRFREDLRTAKSLEELNLPESGYSSAQRKFRPERYPKLHYGQEHVMQPLELAVQLESMAAAKDGWLEEWSEIKRISQIDCPDFNQSDVRIPVTSL
ncbi:uncharacterized protein LOC129596017 isoform X2 [Paramacrobiotus metropolitanus]|uniref:uncharacterized protein LOC129596017 isoform X2 n=1 Tax=Paramacrobiotus metropolitanus TaxID=2943436 RepID=UPI002446201D|nr:uncharacterized protein LOC129596017 isoform X2 [Paramacrobiotus metropolitanus]